MFTHNKFLASTFTDNLEYCRTFSHKCRMRGEWQTRTKGMIKEGKTRLNSIKIAWTKYWPPYLTCIVLDLIVRDCSLRKKSVARSSTYSYMYVCSQCVNISIYMPDVKSVGTGPPRIRWYWKRKWVIFSIIKKNSDYQDHLFSVYKDMNIALVCQEYSLV